MRTKIVMALFIAGAAMSPAARGVAESGNSHATGGGHYFINTLNLEMQFGFSAVLHKNGNVSGSFHHQGILEDKDIDFHAKVTCVSFDAPNGRAWIGGVITKNRSEHPSFMTDVHQVGHDIWFRVLDTGPGQSDDTPDRSTFIGFEGIIPSSENYCDTQPWPADNARTWPVTGNVSVNVDVLPMSLAKSTRGKAGLAPERAREMTLIREPGGRRDIGDR